MFLACALHVESMLQESCDLIVIVLSAFPGQSAALLELQNRFEPVEPLRSMLILYHCGAHVL